MTISVVNSGTDNGIECAQPSFPCLVLMEDITCSVGACLLGGAGRAFCAGQDLADPAMQTVDGKLPDIGNIVERYFKVRLVVDGDAAVGMEPASSLIDRPD